jgi:uncharacterized membrane protein YccF (DUF307 family)
MNTLGNLLWIIFGGWIIFLLYLFGSFVLFLTIIGIPFGIQTLKMAMLSLSPFGREISHGERSGGCLYILVNIIWVLVAGVELAIVHLVLAVLCAITIIGLPFAQQHLKLAMISLVPFGVDIKESKN